MNKAFHRRKQTNKKNTDNKDMKYAELNLMIKEKQTNDRILIFFFCLSIMANF